MPAMRRSNFMILGARHPPNVWALQTPHNGCSDRGPQAGIERSHW